MCNVQKISIKQNLDYLSVFIILLLIKFKPKLIAILRTSDFGFSQSANKRTHPLSF